MHPDSNHSNEQFEEHTSTGFPWVSDFGCIKETYAKTRQHLFDRPILKRVKSKWFYFFWGGSALSAQRGVSFAHNGFSTNATPWCIKETYSGRKVGGNLALVGLLGATFRRKIPNPRTGNSLTSRGVSGPNFSHGFSSMSNCNISPSDRMIRTVMSEVQPARTHAWDNRLMLCSSPFGFVLLYSPISW